MSGIFFLNIETVPKRALALAASPVPTPPTRFSYSGQGSDTVFLVGTSGSPGSSGFVLPFPSDPSRPKAYRYYEEPAPTIRRTFDNEDVVLKLPDSITADEVP